MNYFHISRFGRTLENERKNCISAQHQEPCYCNYSFQLYCRSEKKTLRKIRGSLSCYWLATTKQCRVCMLNLIKQLNEMKPEGAKKIQTLGDLCYFWGGKNLIMNKRLYVFHFVCIWIKRRYTIRNQRIIIKWSSI